KSANLMRAAYLNFIRDKYRIAQSALVNEADAKYQVSETNRKLALSQLKLAQQRVWIIGMTALALLGLSLGFFLWRHRQHRIKLENLRASLRGEERERVRLARSLHDGVLSGL